MDHDLMTDDELDEPTHSELKELTRNHLVDKSKRERCYNQGCPITFVFPSLRRPHHCKRCGEIFCRNCLQYSRRLNLMAQPDPQGVLHRVCLKCYSEREIFTQGMSRSHTNEFLRMRTEYHEERRKLVCDVTIEIKKADTIPAFWKEQFDVNIQKECQRLLDGFSDKVGSSNTYKTLEELQSLVTIPHWQKSTYWELEKSTAACRKCRSTIARFRKKRNCRVCGLALCKQCAHKELLLYYEDGCRNLASCNSRLAIIRVDGCPEEEPRYSLLLHVCAECKEFITEKQKFDADWFIKKPNTPDVTSQLQAIDAIFRDLVSEIENKVQDLNENVKCSTTEDLKQNRRSTVYGLVKSFRQIDLKHDLTKTKQNITEDIQQKLWRYYSLFTKLQRVRHDSKDSLGHSLSKLLNNYIKCRNDYYIQTKSKITAMTKSTEMI